MLQSKGWNVKVESERVKRKKKKNLPSLEQLEFWLVLYFGPVLPSCAHSLFCDERRVSFLGKRVLLVNLLFVRLRQSPQKSERKESGDSENKSWALTCLFLFSIQLFKSSLCCCCWFFYSSYYYNNYYCCFWFTSFSFFLFHL